MAPGHGCACLCVHAGCDLALPPGQSDGALCITIFPIVLVTRQLAFFQIGGALHTHCAHTGEGPGFILHVLTHTNTRADGRT